MILREKDVMEKEVATGIFRKILTYNEDLMVCSFELKKGALLPEHVHINTQSSYVVKGKLKFFLDGKENILEAGDNIFMVPNVPHRVEVLEDSKIIDVFTPMRKDFVE